MSEATEEKAGKKSKGEKARDTLYRVAYRSQITLVQIADNKANLIISINAMIISSIIAISGYGLVADRLHGDRSTILVPVALILLSCLTSTIFAIQAAKPKLIESQPLDEKKNKTSLIFFGEISQHLQSEYLQRMNALRTSEEEMYETMNIDLYNQGLILNRKYRLLNQAYRVFLFGFIMSVWVFLAFLAVA